jgi:hypothetical protein
MNLVAATVIIAGLGPASGSDAILRAAMGRAEETPFLDDD